MNAFVKRWLTHCALGLAVLSPARGAEPSLASLTNQLVGAWTDFGRVEFSGLKTFSAPQLRSALLRDVPFLLASHPQAPRAQFLPTLERRLADGFQMAGFPEVRVRATLDEPARRVRVNITEGPRYVSGDVHITGAVTVPVTNLVRRLTEKWLPAGLPSDADQRGALVYLNSAGVKVEEEHPLWEPGKPASFDAASLEFITRRLTNVLAESGCFFSTVKPRVILRPGTDRADLSIDLDEGRRGRLGHIQVLGLKRNSTDAVLKWLDLAPGQSMTNDLIGRLERQLWSSGRFLTYRVVPLPIPGQPDLVDLDLRLEELPEAPLLGKGFSREEQVMLKFRDWILKAPALGDDVLVSLDWGKQIGETEFVISGQGAVALHHLEGSLRYAISVSRGGAAFLSLLRQRTLKLGSDDSSASLSVSMLPQEESESGGRFNILLGAGVTRRGDAPRSSPLQLNLALAPVAFIHMAHPTNQTVKFEGDSLVFTGEDMTMKIDAASGRLVELLGTDESDSVRVRVRVERGAFDRRWKELASASADFPDPTGTNQPFSHKLGVLAAEVFQLQLLSTNFPQTTTAAQRSRAVAAMERVYTRTFAFLDPLLAADGPGTNTFSIPTVPLRLGQSAQLTGMATMAAWIFEYADQILPARSWPWTLARETVFTLGGQGQHTEAELKGIYTSDDSGPLAFLSTALLLSRIDSPTALTFAARGLERLSPGHFHKDCRLVLDPQTPLGRMFRDTARTLRDLPDDDVDAIAAVLPRRHAVFLRLVITRLKAAPDKPLAETLAPLLEEFWKSDLRQLVETSLRNVTGQAGDTAEIKRIFDEALKADGLKLYADAVRGFRQAAELGMPDAQYALAQCLEKGLGGPRDESAAAHWYHVAASNGVVEAQMLLGTRYNLGLDGPGDAVEAYFWYSVAARNGDRAVETFRNSARRKLTPAQIQEVERRLQNPGASREK